MKLYHCSNMDFDKIDLSKSKPNKDFGRAFYLSEHADEIKPVGKAKVLLHGGELLCWSMSLMRSCSLMEP